MGTVFFVLFIRLFIVTVFHCGLLLGYIYIYVYGVECTCRQTHCGFFISFWSLGKKKKGMPVEFDSYGTGGFLQGSQNASCVKRTAIWYFCRVPMTRCFVESIGEGGGVDVVKEALLMDVIEGL